MTTIKSEIDNAAEGSAILHYRAAFYAGGLHNGLHLAANILEQALAGKRLSRAKLEAVLTEIHTRSEAARDERNTLEDARIPQHETWAEYTLRMASGG